MELKENKEYLKAGICLLEYLGNSNEIIREEMVSAGGDYWRPLRAELGRRDIFNLVNSEFEVFQRPDLVKSMLAEYRYELKIIEEREKELRDQKNDRRNSKIAQWVLIVITTLTLLLSAYQVLTAK